MPAGKVQKLIWPKKKLRRLNDSIGKVKELWKALKFLGSPNKTWACGINVLKVNKTMTSETESALDVFKNYYRTFSQPLQTNVCLTL